MDLHNLLIYREFLLNKKAIPTVTVVPVGRKNLANFCSICGDDCVCMNSSYGSYSSYRKLLNNKNLMLCSKYCNEDVFKDCLCLQK